MRQRLGLLVDEAGKPEGGSWNYDKQNRKPFDGREVPPPRSFPPDELTRAALADVERLCPAAIGSTDGFALPVTREQALQSLDDFITCRLHDFGPFEDAMSSQEGVLFHSLLSPLVNIGLLQPLEMANAAIHAYHNDGAPLNSVEGFVRQIIGWREYMYYRYWELMPDLRDVNAWNHTRSLPDWFWSGETRMNCLHHVIARALRDGYNHHIERLMVVCNFAMLAGLRPQEVNAWFLECYIDAYDWVMLPNVLGMGLNADGGKIATKPYIASANYIHRMSDYCNGCHYKRKARSGEDACPFNTLYWDFLLHNEESLRANPRSGPAVLSLRHLDEDERAAIRQQAQDQLDHINQL
jgi:deoxyribodipyrimidine photolyase-related protein